MTATVAHHALCEQFKPVGWEISVFSPLHDWRHIYRKGWGADMKRNVYGRAIATLFFHTQLTGLCGRSQTPEQCWGGSA